MNEFKDIHIETTLPKPWETEETFNDVLYDWMSRAPWLAISAAAHLVAFLIIQAIPWALFMNDPEVEIQATVEQAPEEIIEDPPEEEIEEIEEEETEEEPIIQDFEISDHNETDTDEEFESTEGDPDMFADSPFDNEAFNDVIGIGGGAGGKFGGRFGGRRNLRAAGGSGTEQALKDGLEWLKKHQAEDGSWDCDDFMINNVEGGTDCDGAGQAQHDVGVTGLALLAFLGDGNTMKRGPYKEIVIRGIRWLRSQQDFDNGLIGEEIGHAFIYNHAIATLAICETYYIDKSPLIKGTAQKAINYITRARNPYGVWRYDVPPVGDNDSSVTGWMIFALKSAQEAGLKIDEEAYNAAMNWFDEVTDVGNGRVGYTLPGELSSRVTGINDHYPPEKGEAMTSVGLLCRFFLGQDPDKEPVMKQHADLLKKTLPEWDPEGFGCDMYYWYYGSYAMYQMGGSHWKAWNEAMKPAVLKSQRKDGDFLGSWDPVGPWGYAGGRVYATATMVLCLEVYFRYAKVLGAR
ncbi:MAG: hypothetical protein ACI841_003830 [Planctomycetota bacterium]|jgi:hypothetical protein